MRIFVSTHFMGKTKMEKTYKFSAPTAFSVHRECSGLSQGSGGRTGVGCWIEHRLRVG